MKQFVIAQIGSSEEVISLVPQGGVIWAHRIYAPSVDLENSFWVTAFGGTFEGLADDPIGIINAVTAYGTPFTFANSYNDLYANINSFYWEVSTQILYIRIFEDSALYLSPPEYSQGVAIGISSAADLKQDGQVDMTIGGIVYDPVLEASQINANLSVGNWVHNFMVYSNFSLTLVNVDGRYDGDRVYLMNQTVSLLLAEIPDTKDLELADFKTVRIGRVSNIAYEGLETATLSVSDPRKFWSDNIPIVVFENTLNDALNGKAMPLAIGYCFKVPGQRLNPDSTDETASFQIMTTEYGPMTAVSAVWERDTNGEFKSITSYVTDLANGTVTMNSSQYTGSDLYVDMQGIDVGNNTSPIDIAFWLIDNFTTFVLNGSDTDLAAWQKAEEAMSLEDCGYYAPVGSRKLNEALDDILLTSGICMFIEGSKLTCQRISLYDDYESKTLTQYDFAMPPNIIYNDGQYASRVAMDYFNEYADPEPSPRTISLSDKDQELFNQYGRRKLLEYTSIAQYEAQALLLAQERYDRQGFIPIELECEYNEALDIELFDAVWYEYTWNDRNLLPKMLYRIIQLDPIKRTMVLSQYSPPEIVPSAIINLFRKSQGV